MVYSTTDVGSRYFEMTYLTVRAVGGSVSTYLHLPSL